MSHLRGYLWLKAVTAVVCDQHPTTMHTRFQAGHSRLVGQAYMNNDYTTLSLSLCDLNVTFAGVIRYFFPTV